MRSWAPGLVCIAGVLLVVVVRASWRRVDPTHGVLEENERIAERMLAEHLARDPHRPTLGPALAAGDAGALYGRVLPLFGSLSEREREIADWLNDPTSYRRPRPAEIQAFLTKTRRLLRLLRPALTMPLKAPEPLGRHPLSKDDARYIRPWQTLGPVAGAHVSVHLRRGFEEDALDDAVLAWFVGLDLARHGLLLDYLIGISPGWRSQRQLRWAIAHCPISSRRLTILVHELATLDRVTPNITDTWRNDEAFMRLGFTQRMSLKPVEAEENAKRHGSTQQYYVDRLGADMLTQYTTTRRTFTEAVRNRSGRDGTEACASLFTKLRRGTNPLLAYYHGLHGTVYQRAAELNMHTALLRAAVAIARHRAELGRFPESLAALVPAYLPSIPRCPYSGEPLRYAEGRVWSIGGDGDDDGGVDQLESDAIEADGDVVYTLYDDRLASVAWPKDTKPDLVLQVEGAIQDLYRGGKVRKEARALFADHDGDIDGRLVGEFAKIDEAPGLDTIEGRSRAAEIDAVLRRRDGFMDLAWRAPELTKVPTDETLARTVALRWANWWRADLWRTDPRDPIDREEDK